MNQEFQSLITSPQNILFIFDFDGTMLEAKYGSKAILGCLDNDVDVLKRDLDIVFMMG